MPHVPAATTTRRAVTTWRSRPVSGPVRSWRTRYSGSSSPPSVSGTGPSRVTVRRALEVLRDEGLLGARQGFGWYVASDPLQQSLGRLRTIEAQLREAGIESERRILDFRFVAAPARVRAALHTTRVLEVRRVNLADGKPFARVTVWCPESMARDLSLADVQQQSIKQALARQQMLAAAAPRAYRHPALVAAGQFDDDEESDEPIGRGEADGYVIREKQSAAGGGFGGADDGTGDVFFKPKWAYWLRDTIPGVTEVVEIEGARLFLPDERADELVFHLSRHWATHTPARIPGQNRAGRTLALAPDGRTAAPVHGSGRR